jgi:hypothetical protein
MSRASSAEISGVAHVLGDRGDKAGDGVVLGGVGVPVASSPACSSEMSIRRLAGWRVDTAAVEADTAMSPPGGSPRADVTEQPVWMSTAP